MKLKRKLLIINIRKLCCKIKQANLVSKSDIADLVKKKDFDNKLSDLNKRINSNKTKHVLVENELKKIEDI